jgi:hypothetical protein
MVGWVDNELWNKQSWSNLKYYSGNCMAGLSQGIWFSGRDLNAGPVEYGAHLSTIQEWRPMILTPNNRRIIVSVFVMIDIRNSWCKYYYCSLGCDSILLGRYQCFRGISVFTVERAQEIYVNRWDLSTKLHGITSQMTIIIILVAVITSNFISWNIVYTCACVYAYAVFPYKISHD